MFQAVLDKVVLKANGLIIPNPEIYVPVNNFNFSVDLELIVSIEGRTQAKERFDVEVCTPSWIADHIEKDFAIFGSGIMIVHEFSFSKIDLSVKKYIKMCRGKSVDDVLRRVGLLGDWESEWEI